MGLSKINDGEPSADDAGGRYSPFNDKLALIQAVITRIPPGRAGSVTMFAEGIAVNIEKDDAGQLIIGNVGYGVVFDRWTVSDESVIDFEMGPFKIRSLNIKKELTIVYEDENRKVKLMNDGLMTYSGYKLLAGEDVI